MANTNEYLVWGWSVQQNGATAGQSGYSQPGNAPAAGAAGALEASSGNGFSPAGTGAYGPNPVLSSPGYAVNPALVTPGPLTAPSLPTSGTGIALNPSGLEAQVTVTTSAGATVTAVAIAAAGSSTFQTTGFTLAASSDGTFQVPAAAQVKITYTGTPTWVWTAVN